MAFVVIIGARFGGIGTGGMVGVMVGGVFACMVLIWSCGIVWQTCGAVECNEVGVVVGAVGVVHPLW